MSRPREVLNAFGRAHFGAWKALDRLRAARRTEWPPYVYAPLDIAGLAVIEALREAGKPRATVAWDAIGPASELAGLAAWRITQQVYRFDPDLYAALLATPITGEIPGEHFRRLPAWCVYVETPGLTVPLVGGGDEPLHGVFAWLDWRKDRAEDILTLGLDTDAQLAVNHVPLVGTLEASLAQVEADWREGAAAGVAAGVPPDGYAQAAKRTVGPILSLLLYLSAQDADYVRPAWPAPKRTKQGWRLFPADKPTVWGVGERIGAVLRRSVADRGESVSHTDSGRASPRPHIRASHWHSFWRGPRDGERSRVVKWLPPLLVSAEGLDQLPVTVRPVKGPAKS
jgi:hypothetical protein